jgi:hypothetical protein
LVLLAVDCFGEASGIAANYSTLRGLLFSSS